MEKFKEYKREFTDEEMVLHAWDKEMIQNTVSRLMLYWGNGELQRALDELWVVEAEHQADASFGTNNGFFVGINEVKRHLINEYEAREQETLNEFMTARPGAGYTVSDLGLGMTRMHSCTTPLLFIAADDKTARYLCYDLGMSGRGKPDGTGDCYLEFGLVFIELIREGENGDFKIWHVVQQHDFSIESGVNYNDVPTVITYPNDPSMKDFGDPTVITEVYNNQFGWEYLYYDIPKPYKFYDEDEGYGVNGKIGKKFYQRII